MSTHRDTATQCRLTETRRRGVDSPRHGDAVSTHRDTATRCRLTETRRRGVDSPRHGDAVSTHRDTATRCRLTETRRRGVDSPRHGDAVSTHRDTATRCRLTETRRRGVVPRDQLSAVIGRDEDDALNDRYAPWWQLVAGVALKAAFGAERKRLFTEVLVSVAV